MQRGKSVDSEAMRGPLPCYLVGRDVPGANSPFQLQCVGSRIVAQKIIYAAYQELSSENMGYNGFDIILTRGWLGWGGWG